MHLVKQMFNDFSPAEQRRMKTHLNIVDCWHFKRPLEVEVLSGRGGGGGRGRGGDEEEEEEGGRDGGRDRCHG